MRICLPVAAVAAISLSFIPAVSAQSEWQGYSYGGVLRDGPGTEYQQVGSLVDGDWISVIENTDVWTDGYQWFYVDSHLGAGYQWGGIMCIDGQDYPDGMLGIC
jgi:hypothetical protein